jgi:uncharacterized membrane protein YozB (DUF420 family)
LGFLGTEASNLIDINLILQTAIIAFLGSGWFFARRARFLNHGKFMATAIVLNILSLIFVMFPSLVEGAGVIVEKPTNPGLIISVIHVLVGGFALSSGVYFLWKWRFSKTYMECLGRRNWMRITAYLWTVATLTGIGFYIYYYL